MPKLSAKDEEARKKAEEKIIKEEKEKASKIAAILAEEQRLRAIEKSELKFRIAELYETREFLNKHHQALAKIQRERATDYIWHRYLLCDGLPNPIIEKEINTYMSIWRMNEERICMEDVIFDSINAMKLIDELQTLIADMDEGNTEIERYRATMQDLRELVQEKVGRACVETLTKASHFADPETANLQKFWRNNWLSLCIWGNLSKNPRIKRYTFEETGITFSIPRALTLSDCAFRVVFMKFDTYSVTSLSAKPREYMPIVQQNSETSGKDDEKSVQNSHKSNKSEELENATEKDDAKSKERIDLLLDFSDGDNEEKGEEDEEIIEPPEEDRIQTPPKTVWDPIPLPDDAIDLCDYHLVGGVFQFDLLKLPRQPKTGRGWLWTNCVVPPELVPFEYIVDSPDVDEEDDDLSPIDEDNADPSESEGQEDAGAAADEAGGEAKLDPSAQKARDEKFEPNPPVEVKLRLPKCLIIPEEPVLARWDAENLIWRTNGIVIDEFVPEQNEISFRTAVFGTFGVFQEFHLNMPFQHWEMRPLPRVVIKKSEESDQTYDSASMNDPLEVDGPSGGETNGEKKGSNEQPSQSSVDGGRRSSQVEPNLTGRHSTTTAAAPKATASVGTPNEMMALGPLPSMGIPDEIYLADKTEADQCLITITGAYIRVQLHVLDDRVAIRTEDPHAILDPVKIAEEEAAAAAKAAGHALEDEDASSVTTSRRRTGGGGIGGTTAGLSDDAREPLELAHLTGRWFTPDELISVLMCSGVNLFPRADSCTRVECIEKNSIAEQRLYEHLALLSPVMAFGWSRWNAACQNAQNIIIVGTEHIDNYGPVDEERWKVYSMNRKQVYQMTTAEAVDQFHDNADPSLQRHADFYHMYMEIGSDEGKERVRRIQSRYFKTVLRILKSTRLPVFS